jgi:hypothetical protein
VLLLVFSEPAQGGRRGSGATPPPLQDTLQLVFIGDSRGLEESTQGHVTTMVNWARDQRAVEGRGIAGVFHHGDLEGNVAAPNADRAGQGTALQALPFWFNWSLVPSHSDSSNAAGIPAVCPGAGCNADRFIADIGNAAQGVTWDGPNFHTSFTVPVGGTCESGYDNANVRAVVHRFPFGRSGVGVFNLPWDADCEDVIDAQLTTYMAAFPNDVLILSSHGLMAGGPVPASLDAQFTRNVDNCLSGSNPWTSLRRLFDNFPVVFVATSHCPTVPALECYTTTNSGGLALSGCTQDYAAYTGGTPDDDGDMLVMELSCAEDTISLFQVDPIDEGGGPAPCEWEGTCCPWVDPDGSPPGYGTPDPGCNAESWVFPADLKARGVC